VSEPERKLLLLVARLLAKVILWKKINSSDANKIYEAIEELK
jgi:hypothetical protein